MLALTKSGKTGNSKWNQLAYFLLAFDTYFKFLENLHNGEDVVDSYNNDELILSERDSRFLLSVMENPPEPSSGLLAVFE
ncbi:MAG: hypothetical protein F6K58_26600 [Symploca sp. SIO2E9]|nr:hypothetical protein [Symploca sp. SIO2E9]